MVRTPGWSPNLPTKRTTLRGWLRPAGLAEAIVDAATPSIAPPGNSNMIGTRTPVVVGLIPQHKYSFVEFDSFIDN